MLLARTVLVVVLVLTPAAAASADEASSAPPQPAHQWGVSIWGVSYHFDRAIDYNENNWGLGLRFVRRPPWKWLARDKDNRTFVEVDVLRNSYNGLVLPLSAGLEYKLGSVSGRCNAFAMAALAIAYYRKGDDRGSEIRYGPIPGISIGCGRVKSNLLIVLSPRSILAALVGSVTIML